MKRVRGRIEVVLDYATAMKARTGDNPARWNGGNLKHLLAAPSKIAPVVHYDALNYKRMGEFMTQLRQREGIGALALEFTMLTAARTGEALGATWAEIDRDENVWIIPPGRMKAGREHRVPLSRAAMAVLDKAEKISKPVDANALIFLSDRTAKRLSKNTLTAILLRMNYNVTVHGFRSCFRDWAGEESHFPNDVIEMALAHQVGTQTERAYRRKDAFQKRRALAEAWAGYCAKPAVTDAKVLTFVR